MLHVFSSRSTHIIHTHTHFTHRPYHSSCNCNLLIWHLHITGTHLTSDLSELVFRSIWAKGAPIRVFVVRQTKIREMCFFAVCVCLVLDATTETDTYNISCVFIRFARKYYLLLLDLPNVRVQLMRTPAEMANHFQRVAVSPLVSHQWVFCWLRIGRMEKGRKII